MLCLFATFFANAGMVPQSGTRLFASSSSSSSGGGGSECFGFTPTIYAHPSASQGSGNGSSFANARTLASALSLADDDAVVCVNTGTAVGTDTDGKFVPVFQAANSGSSGHPIKIVARYPWTDSGNRTVLTSNAPTTGDGSPTIGAHQRNYIEWYGFYVDEANAHNQGDSGIAMISESTGVKVMYCRIIAEAAHFPADNHVGVYVNESTGAEISYNTITGFRSNGGGNGSGITLYGGTQISITHNAIGDGHTGIYIKGRPATFWNDGTTSYNDLYDLELGIRIYAVDPTLTMTVEHNLVRNFSSAAIFFHTSAGAANSRNAIVRRNTLTGQSNALAISAITGTGNQFNDNLIALYSPYTGQVYTDASGYTDNNFAQLDYNGFYGSAAGNPWNWNGTNYATVAAWQAVITNANNNQVLGNDPLSGRGSGDYTVTGAATTASSTGGPIGADFSLVGPD